MRRLPTPPLGVDSLPGAQHLFMFHKGHAAKTGESPAKCASILGLTKEEPAGDSPVLPPQSALCAALPPCPNPPLGAPFLINTWWAKH